MCQKRANIGEERYGANSLESMIDKVHAISTEVGKGSQLQGYEIAAEVKQMVASNKAIVCRKLNYAYAVFCCRATQNTDACMVPLVGTDGTKVKAVAVCHIDTSSWNPKLLAFKVLKVNPATPVCHLLPEDHVVWVPNNQNPAEFQNGII